MPCPHSWLTLPPPFTPYFRQFPILNSPSLGFNIRPNQSPPHIPGTHLAKLNKIYKTLKTHQHKTGGYLLPSSIFWPRPKATRRSCVVWPWLYSCSTRGSSRGCLFLFHKELPVCAWSTRVVDFESGILVVARIKGKCSQTMFNSLLIVSCFDHVAVFLIEYKTSQIVYNNMH